MAGQLFLDFVNIPFLVIHILINTYVRQLLFIIFSLYSLFYTFVLYTLFFKKKCMPLLIIH